MKTLGIDIGGSFIKFGIQSDDKILHHVSIANTAKSIDQIENIISTQLSTLLEQFDIESIGVGFPGTFNSEGVITSAPNITYGESINIKDWFFNITKLPTFIQNDAYLAGFAESKINSLNEYYFVTLGTGVGSALVRDGQLIESKVGSSGELGHIIINIADEGSDYRTGIFEKYFSAEQFVVKASQDLKNFPNSILHSLDKFTVREISDAVNIGDDLAIINFMEMGKILGIGLSSVANLTGIPIFVIGGGISQVNNLLFETAVLEMRKRTIPELKNHIQILKSKLYNEAGILGAALYAKERIK